MFEIKATGKQALYSHRYDWLSKKRLLHDNTESSGSLLRVMLYSWDIVGV
jgi:hypothetical protein